MRYNGYLISNYDDMSGSYTCLRLIEECSKRDLSLRTVGVYDSLVTENNVINRGEVIEHADFSINRYKWGHVKERINYLCGRTYNECAPFGRFVDKYEQIVSIRPDLFRIPDSILGRPDADHAYLANRLGSPFIAKGLENSRGSEIHLVSSKEDLSDLKRFGPDKEWLFQEYISESRGRDLRVFCIRGTAVAAMERINPQDFRANFALGAQLKDHGITPEIEDIAENVYEQTGLDIIGLDLLFGKDGPCFCELNVMPGLQGIESATGTNIAGRIADIIRSDLDGQI